MSTVFAATGLLRVRRLEAYFRPLAHRSAHSRAVRVFRPSRHVNEKRLVYELFIIYSHGQYEAALKDLRDRYDFIDKDGNGILVMDEFFANFHLHDTNGDGALCYDEFGQDHPDFATNTYLKATFRFHDKIGGVDDSLFTRSDVQGLFDLLDADGDDYVSWEEFLNKYPEMRAQIQAEVDAMAAAAVGK